MVPLESPVREIRTPGSVSRGWKRTYGSRTERRRESVRISHRTLRAPRHLLTLLKREDIAGPQGASSRPMWETLKGMVREKAQEFIQQIMEEEVTELLGREKSERSSMVDSAEGYRNGYGKPRRLVMSSGTITLRRPRIRGVEERFESRVLPLFARRTKELGALLPELYLHGLAEGDFELAMRGLLLQSHVGVYGGTDRLVSVRQRIGIESIHCRGMDNPQFNRVAAAYGGEVGRHIVVPNLQIVVQEGSHLEGFSCFDSWSGWSCRGRDFVIEHERMA